MRIIFFTLCLPICLSANSTAQTTAEQKDLTVTTTPNGEMSRGTETSSSSSDGMNTNGVRIVKPIMPMGGPAIGGGGRGDGGTGITIKMEPMDPIGCMPEEGSCNPLTVKPGPPTIPALPTTQRSSSIPVITTKRHTSSTNKATSRHFGSVSSVSPSGSGYSTDNTVTTSAPGDTGGFSTMAAFAVGLVIGIIGFMICGILVCAWYVHTKKKMMKTQGARPMEMVNLEQSQYSRPSIVPSQTSLISGTMAYHTYEEAGLTGPPLTPHSPHVLNRVSDTRYAHMPGEAVVCADGYTRYRPSISSDQIADFPQPNLNRMYKTLPRPSGSTSNILMMEDESGAGRMRSYSLSAGVYTDLNVNAVRPPVVAQDGYAECLSDEVRNRSRSYSELYTRNQAPRPSSPSGAYTRYKVPRKPPVYTDLTTGHQQPDGYARYNASIHQHPSTYTDLRSGQDRRLPSPPTANGLEGMTRRHKSLGSLPSIDETFHAQIIASRDYTDLSMPKDRKLSTPPDAPDINVAHSFAQRQASIGSLPSINEELDETPAGMGNEAGGMVDRTLLRPYSSSSDDSAYTNPNCDVDEGSVSYEEVGPDIQSPAPGVYIDLDDYFEDDECKQMQPNLCREPPAEDHRVFKHRKSGDIAESQSPFYFKVGDLQDGSAPIESNNNQDQSQNEGPYYFRVGSVRNQTPESKPTNGETSFANKQRSQSEPAYFQLEKPSAVNGDLQQDNDNEDYDVPTSMHVPRKTSISLPITEDVKSEYNHLERTVTLLPVVEPSHYQELGEEDTKL